MALGGGTPPGAGAGVALGRRHREGRSGRAPLWALPQLFALGLLGGCAGAPADPPSGSAIAEALAPHEIAATTLPAEGARGDPSRATAPAAIDRVRVTPKLPDRGGAVADGHPPGAGMIRIALALSQPADVSLEIHGFAALGATPLRRLSFPSRGAGPHILSWDGRDAAGQPVPPGVYALRLATRNAAGTHSWGDLSPAAGEEVLVQRLTYDRASRQLRFHLPAASYLRVQMRLQDYPHLRTVLDWEPRPAGWHTVTWDGWDRSRVLALADDPRLRVELAAYALPRHAVIVRGRAADTAPSSPAAASLPTYRSGTGCLQSGNPPRACWAPRFTLELPDAPSPHPDNGLPRLAGAVPVRIRLAEADVASLLQSRFEVMVFVDAEFWFEEEEGTHPLTFRLDTRGLPPGVHVLTVNLATYDDRLGSRSLRFYKEEEVQ